jgi:hypothetical protein
LGRRLTRSLSVLLSSAALLAACGGSDSPPLQAATTYTVSTAASSGGAITPASVLAQAGTSAGFSLAPEAGYELVSVTGCDGTLDAAAGSYATGAVTGDCTVTAQFAALPPTVVQITGVAVDATGGSLAGVEAYNASGVLATSDAQGRLSFELPPDAAGAVRLRKAGYTRQTVVLNALDGQAQFVGTLGRSNLPVTINIDAKLADLVDGSGARVSLSPGTVVDRQGKPVTGDFQVTVTSVDVSDNAALKVFPGSFSALDMNGEPVPVLMPYGTMEVHLTQDGEPLNLAPGAVAAIEIPIFVTEYPDGTPIAEGDLGGEVWSLDEDTGVWQLEGTGTVVAADRSPTGLALRTLVSHFSWWNFDYADRVMNPDGSFSSACDVPVLLRNLPAGVTVMGQFIDDQPNRPRWSSSLRLTNGQVIRVPRDRTIEVVAAGTGADGLLYRATTVFSCPGGGLQLDFEGPLAPLVQAYTASIRPVFALDASGLNEVVQNEARLSWTVVGQSTLNLMEPELPLNQLLTVAQGSLNLPLAAPVDPANDLFNFTLVATNDVASTQLQKTLAYITEAPPLVEQFNYSFILSRPLVSGWSVLGADEIDVGYVPIGSPTSALTVLPGYSGQLGGGVEIPANVLPNQGEGYDIVVVFKNQYGSTYRRFTHSECLKDPDGSCAITD